jgi:hypothetical protein
LEEVDKTVERIGPAIAREIQSLFAPLIAKAPKLPAGATNEDMGRQMYALSGSINDYNSRALHAIIPIALRQHNSTKTEVIGSGVIVQIHNETFLLTAAHVLDRESDGDLLVPGKLYFSPLAGHFFKLKPPASGRREDDKFDVAYCCLDNGLRSNLHSNCAVLERPDCSFEKATTPKLYTLAGYPWRKTNSAKGAIHTEFTTLMGFEASEADYKQLGLSKETHIVVKLNRKRMMSQNLKRTIKPPSPEGMSGGGIYVWTKSDVGGFPVSLLLAGVATAFKVDRSLLIATRLNVFLRCIYQNRPSLFTLK